MKPRIFRLMFAGLLLLLAVSLYTGFSDLASRNASRTGLIVR